MATETERLVVQLEARVTEFEKGMRRAQQQSDRTTREIERRFDATAGGIGSKLKTLAGAFGVALSGAAVVGLIRDAARLADDLGDVAQQLGLTTDQLQALQYAALEAGLSSERLDTGLDSLTRVLGDAVSGQTEAIAKFKALGVEIFDAEGRARGFAEILPDVAQKILGLANPTEQSAAAVDFFGKTGARTVPFLTEVASGFTDLTQRASDAGRVMSEETVQVLGDANKELDRLGRVLQVASAEAVVFGAAMANALPDAVRQLAQLKQAREALADGFVTGHLPALEVTPESSGRTYRPETGGAGGKSNAFQSAIEAAQARTAALQAETEALQLTATAGQRLVEIQNLTAAATKANLPLDEERLQLIYETADALARQTGELNFGKAIQAAEQQIQSLRQQAQTVGLTAKETERFKVEQELLNQAVANGIPLTDQLREQIAGIAQAQADASQAVRDATAEVEAQGALLEDLRGIGEQAFDRIGGAITDAFARGQGAAVNFGAVAQAVIADVIQSLIKLAAQKAFDLIASALGGTGGGYSYYPPGVGPGGQGFTHFGGPRAAGGPVSAGKTYLVGEKGPELFSPARGGMVMPNAALTQAPVIKVQPVIQAPPAPPVTVTVINRASDTEARAERRQDSNGTSIEVMIDRIVAGHIGRQGSSTNRALREAGVKPRLARR